jgi:hypothetical protein
MKRLLICLGVALALALPFSGTIWKHCCALSFSQSDLRRYERLFDGRRGGRVGGGAVPFRTGKVVVVRPSVQSVYISSIAYSFSWNELDPGQRGKIAREVDPPRLDDAWYDLDAELRASSPEEVRTVVLCAPQAAKEGIYVSKDPDGPQPYLPATRVDLLLHVYDLPTRTLIGSYTLKGDSAPSETTYFGRHQGAQADLAEFIARMPQKSL